MSLFDDVFNAVGGVFNSVFSTAKMLTYVISGGVVIAVVVTTQIGGTVVTEVVDAVNDLPQIPGRVLTYTGIVKGGSGVGGHFVGKARFQVITPTLIRLEYAEDNKFEDNPTMLAFNRNITPPAYDVIETTTQFTIKTSKVTMTYNKNSGQFNDNNLKIVFNDGTRVVNAKPTWASKNYGANPLEWGLLGYIKSVSSDANNTPSTSGDLGGWYRSLDSQSNAVPLHKGLLSRNGFAFVDDTKSAVIKGHNWYDSRPFHNNIWQPGDLIHSIFTLNLKPLEGDYQDGYIFAYGNDYKTALKDYRTLSGAVPLLPRKAFGVWYSKYYPFTDSQYRNEVFPAFRNEKVPMDVLAIDTDAKAPVAWNGWNWNTKLIPNPKDTLSWMHGQGVDVMFNTHPSISSLDPKLAATKAIVGSKQLLTSGGAAYFFQWGTGLLDGSRRLSENLKGIPLVFDFDRSSHVDAFMKLHDGFDADGIDGYWLDWCCDDSNVGGQINKGEFSSDNWLNQQYTQRNAARGNRWLPLSRIGASFQDWHSSRPGVWGAQRSAIHFTGDTVATWPMLNFQARFAAAEGSAGIAYVSHDVGGFQLATLFSSGVASYDSELYVRWVQLSAFQPILRLHAGAGAGNTRLPWEFTGATRAVSAEFLRLRGALVPYLYSTARESHDTGLPMVRAMYFDYPQQETAYQYNYQYMLGSQLLVAPIGTPADKTTGLASKKVWFPPNNNWVDIFTGQVYAGGTEVTVNVPLERMPVFAKQGTVLPLAPYMDYSAQKPLDNLKLSVFTGQDGEYSLYEDDGAGLGYMQSKFARTRLSFNDYQKEVRIAATAKQFDKQLSQRAYQIKVVNTTQPTMVLAGGVYLPVSSSMPNDTTPSWYYDAATQTLHIQTAQLNTQQEQVIAFR